MAHVLVVDDDGHIRDVVCFALERAGFRVDQAADGAAGMAAFDREAPDLVVLDVLMPEADGLAVCRHIRAAGDVPVLFLSSRDDEIDRVLGLEIGGDDYMTKPFSPRELVARVRAILRRTGGAARGPAPESPAEQVLRAGPLTLDIVRHRCRWGDADVALTATEHAVLRVLFGMVGKVYSRAELVDRAWGDDHAMTERTVDSHIRRMRAKLAQAGGDPIETVRGVGYRLRDDA